MTENEIVAFLSRAGLTKPGEIPTVEPLTVGVSSDIWKVVTADGAVCVKRALPTLKTETELRPTTRRNTH